MYGFRPSNIRTKCVESDHMKEKVTSKNGWDLCFLCEYNRLRIEYYNSIGKAICWCNNGSLHPCQFTVLLYIGFLYVFILHARLPTYTFEFKEIPKMPYLRITFDFYWYPSLAQATKSINKTLEWIMQLV